VSVDNGGGAVLWLILSLVVFWLVIYTAVRVAVGQALDRNQQRLVAEARTTPDGVEFAITNLGTAPAIDLFVRWSNDSESVLAHTPLLAENGRLEWTIAGEPIPNETQVVRSLLLDWAVGVDPSASGRNSSRRAVLVPSRMARPTRH
jgi:hypothetical protein